MITRRLSHERGQSQFDWLDSRHTFSFGRYHDPQWTGFGPIRVINDDRVAAGRGFEPHPHAHMEILSYVLSGQLAHQDSMGNGSVIDQSQLQRMSAGTGVTHSEYNASSRQPVHFLQIWIQPDAADYSPSYQQRTVTEAEKHNQFALVASKTGREGSLSLNQTVDIHIATLDQTAEPLSYRPEPGRALWLQVAQGSVTVQGQPLVAGDGAAILNEPELCFSKAERAEVLLFSFPV